MDFAQNQIDKHQAKNEGDVPRALTDSLSLLSTKRKLSDLLAAQHRRNSRLPLAPNVL